MKADSAVHREYQFGPFHLDARERRLSRGGEMIPLRLKVFDTLLVLVENAGRLITKQELLEAIWPETTVEENNLNHNVSVLRKALGERATGQQYIETVPRVGYRFVAAVDAIAATPAWPSTASASLAAKTRQEIRYCTTSDGVRLAYATTGSGPPLVKASNWLTHLDFEWGSPIWRHWYAELSRHHRLVRYDERGNGMSQRDVGDVSFDTWVRDLETVVDAAGLDRFPLLASPGAVPSRSPMRRSIRNGSRTWSSTARLRRVGTTAARRRISRRAARLRACYGLDGDSTTLRSAEHSPAASFPRPHRSTRSGSTNFSASPHHRKTRRA